jgi:hypothetical protein
MRDRGIPWQGGAGGSLLTITGSITLLQSESEMEIAKLSEVSEPSLSQGRGGLVAQHRQKYVRASERRRPRTDGRATDVEIESAEKLRRDLIAGIRNLRALWPQPYDFSRRLLEQAAKIRSVEAKLFRLRQGRLL